MSYCRRFCREDGYTYRSFFPPENKKRKYTDFILLVILFSMHVYFHKNQNVKPLIDVVA